LICVRCLFTRGFISLSTSLCIALLQ
jgi:hypothetical protein